MGMGPGSLPWLTQDQHHLPAEAVIHVQRLLAIVIFLPVARVGADHGARDHFGHGGAGRSGLLRLPNPLPRLLAARSAPPWTRLGLELQAERASPLPSFSRLRPLARLPRPAGARQSMRAKVSAEKAGAAASGVQEERENRGSRTP